MISSINLIIDGNYLMHKTLAVYFSSDAEAKIPKLTSPEDKALYMRKCLTDFCHLIRNFYTTNLSTIIMTVDSRSWRKDIEIEENQGYKAHRKRGSDINWEGFYEVFNDLTKIIEKQGIYISKLPSAEGDDLMYLFAQKNLSRGEDTILLTGDKDMWQCVDHKGENFIAAYSNNSKFSKLIVHNETFKQMQYKSFENSDIITAVMEAGGLINLKYLQTFADKHNIQITVIDPIKHAFNKVFIGDGGDGVPGLYVWETQPKGIVRKNYLTELRIEPIWNLISKKYKNNVILSIEKESQSIFDLLNKLSKGQANKDYSVDRLTEKIKRNIKLMYLDKSVIPQGIQENFITEYESACADITKYKRFNVYNFQTKLLVEGTKYVKTEPVKITTNYFNDNFDKDDYFFTEESKTTII